MISALYYGATGMKTISQGMSVVSNNLANVNSVAYKQQSAQYEDIMGSYLASSSSTTGVSQVGSGSALSDVRTLFTQGAFETTTLSTDLAISGIGFFGVSSNGQTRYTRAGNFTFTASGELVDSNGWNVMGRKLSNGSAASELSAVTLDLEAMTMSGKASSTVSAYANLGGLKDAISDPANPFFSLALTWDGTASSPLSSSDYAYAQEFQYYDATGNLRSGTIYFDSAGTSGGLSAVEYLIAIDPSSDGSSLSGTRAAGLLGAGTLTFDATGNLVNMTAFSPPASGQTSDLTAWTAAPSSGGYPSFTFTPAGSSAQTISFDLGISIQGSMDGGLSSPADALANQQAIFSINGTAARGSSATRAYGDTPGIIGQAYDGYAPGSLSQVSVGTDGTVTGLYSNGQSEDLYRISLFRFTSEDGLINEGNGQYSSSTASGSAQEGIAGDENFGTIESYALEQSNVDYAAEFSNLIVTQRGFQMNSKVISTVDTMLQKALELKR